MNGIKHSFTLIWLLAAAMMLVACGEPDAPPELRISGTVSGEALTDHPNQPAMLVVSRSDDIAALQNDPLNSVIAYVGIDRSDNSFQIDLSNRGLTAGDKILIAAFIDMSPSDKAPFPDIGDIIGLWIDPATFSTGYTLSSGNNSGLNIHINREIFDFRAAVTGTVLGNETGNLTLIAYAGEITSPDFTTLDPDKIAGFTQLEMKGAPIAYVLPILPYGFDVPIENVHIFALLDANGNGGMDTGDKIGYFTTGPPYQPAALTVTAGMTAGIDLGFFITVEENPAGAEPLLINGELVVPDQNGNPSPLFVLVVKAEANPYDLGSLLENLRYFERLPEGTAEFHIDLSHSGLQPGDGVMVLGLWDHDNRTGFPEPTADDMVGFYIDPVSLSPVIPLVAGRPDNIRVSIDRRLTDNQGGVSIALETAPKTPLPNP